MACADGGLGLDGLSEPPPHSLGVSCTSSMTEKVLKSVVNGFLGTYSSRYSDKDGYWLFGFVVESLSSAEIDLLSSSIPPTFAQPLKEATTTAQMRFREQLEKHGLRIDQLQYARLRMEHLPGKKQELTPGDSARTLRDGWDVRFVVEAIGISGKRYSANKSTFIAPHDPRKELKSRRGDS